MMKKATFTLIVFALTVISTALRAQYASSNFSLIGQLDPETTYNSDSLKYSGCWGWYQPDKKKEYAIACSHRGTYWIDITVPSTPTLCAYRAGKKSGCTWREAKSYKNYLYVISDDWGTNSFQIFDMQYLPDSVHKVYDSTGLFRQGHTLWVDGDRLYVASVSTANTYSSMCVYSLANPEKPVKLRSLEDDYGFISTVHDMFVRNDTVYASCAYQGLHVFHFNGSTFSILGSLTSYTASGYNHSSALTPDGKTLVFADEVPSGLPFKVADVTNLSNIQVLATANQFQKTTPHNPFVPNNALCFLSSYQDGLQLYDISNPSTPLLAGYFDTYPQGGGNINTYLSKNTYHGQWGCYPFFPSGNVFALDRFNGAFILRTPLYGGPYIEFGPAPPALTCLGTTIVSEVPSVRTSSVSWSGQGLVITPVTSHLANVTFTAAGVYTLAITAANSGSTAAIVHTITVTSLAASSSATNPSCFSCTDGVISITHTGGAAPLSYSWTPAGTGSVSSGLAAGCYTVAISDAAGCADTVNACLVSPAVGVKKIPAAGIRLYPIPAHDRIFVDVPKDHEFRFSVHDALGHQVLSDTLIHDHMELDVSQLPKGIYMLMLSDGKEPSVLKFVLE